MLPRRFAGLAAAALTLTLSFTPIAPTWAGTITVTDVLDREVVVPDKAERVLLGFYFEDFLAITGPEAFERVVAISKETWHGWRNLQWQAYREPLPMIESLIDIGEGEAGTFSIETAIAARPDVAILAEWQFTGMGDAVAKLEAAGIPVVVADYNAQTVERHVASTMLIGKVMGAEARAKQLADEYAAAVADVEARVAAAQAKSTGGKKKRVYVELGNKGPQEYGNTYTDYMWGKVIGLAGGDNIALGQVGLWAPLNPEFVLARNPEVVFVAGSGWAKRPKAVLMGPGVEPTTTHARLVPYLERPGWAEMTAVKGGQVHALYHGGSRTLYDYAFLQYIAKALHPEAFADIDPQATLKRFFDTYLPIDAKGTYMMQLP